MLNVCEYRYVFVHRTQGQAGGWVRSQSGLCPLWQARIILEKATKVSFKQVDDLASVWCECGELELRHENYDQALQLLRVSTTWVVGRACGHVAQSAVPPPKLPCSAVSLQKATALPARRAEYFDGSEPVQNRVYKSLKVWSMLADLEESLGTFQVSCLDLMGCKTGGATATAPGSNLPCPRSPPRPCMTASWTCVSPPHRSSSITPCSWRSTSTLRRASR